MRKCSSPLGTDEHSGICRAASPSTATQTTRLECRMAKNDKIKATKKAKAAARKAQTIKIDENWSIVRIDDLNWQIRHTKQRLPFDRWYFGTLRGAFLALPDKMIGEEAKDAIADVSRCYTRFCDSVLSALSEDRQ